MSERTLDPVTCVAAGGVALVLPWWLGPMGLLAVPVAAAWIYVDAYGRESVARLSGFGIGMLLGGALAAAAAYALWWLAVTTHPLTVYLLALVLPPVLCTIGWERLRERHQDRPPLMLGLIDGLLMGQVGVYSLCTVIAPLYYFAG